MIEFLVASYVTYIALKREYDDLMKVEGMRDETIKSKDVAKMFKLVERIRRVTWRMGILGASVLATLLLFMNIIPRTSWLSVAAVSWIVITSVLNFRAYHLEDEGLRVFVENK